MALLALERVEQGMVELYNHFYKLFSKDLSTSFVFYKMSLDERSHVAVLKHLKKLKKEHPEMFTNVHFDIIEIEKILVKIDEAVKLTDCTIKDAIKKILDIESAIDEQYITLSTLSNMSSTSYLIRTLNNTDRLIELKNLCGLLNGNGKK